ncbi:haloacid dehalogenase-like hydrolase [Deinococcus fonticola]|uniref:haloacid dehalogenase-like hydrolase n=1 Tax=Deinococcus fonticola TaxID=2528713 RepID=UPI001074E7F8|nr:haloacid dehalogenase-like hydrolase [Deinococcus fonticola]
MICITDLEGTLTSGSVETALERYRQAGQQVRTPAELGEWIVDQELWPKRTPLVELLRLRDAEQVRVIICSTTRAAVLEAFSRRLRAEPLAIAAGTAGRAVPAPSSEGRHKAQQVRRYLRGARVDYAFTHSMEDLPLLDLAVRPCAVDPEPPLLRYAKAKAWRVLTFAGSSGLIL